MQHLGTHGITLSLTNRQQPFTHHGIRVTRPDVQSTGLSIEKQVDRFRPPKGGALEPKHLF